MQILKRAARTAAALLFAVLIVTVCAVLPGTSMEVHAASNLTSIGLAEHGLMAYRDGWKYVYGGYGNYTSGGVRSSDCSGLIYSYLCWTDNNSAVTPNWSYPRTVTQQANRSSESGTLDTLPRTHGLLITTSGYSHVGIYVGNNMVVDNSTWGVDMRLDSINKHGWKKWHKLDCVSYPTNGWYMFDGDYYYYENGEYVVNTTRTIDGVTYTFGSDGLSNKTNGGSNDGYDESDGNSNARTTTGVRLRKGPGTEYGTIAVLSEGTRMNVINTENSEWYAIETRSGQKGYISAKYVKVTGPVVEQAAPEVEAPTEEDPSVNAAEGEPAKTTTAVHLRSGKNKNSNSLGVISAGTSVKVADIGDNSWYKVYVNGKTGYMFREYIRLDSTPVPEQPASGSSHTAKTTAGVHLRSGKGTNFSSVMLINEYTPITVTDTSDSSWYGVSYNGKSGYISSQYISLSGSTSSEKTENSTSAPSTEAATAWTTSGVYMRKGKGTEHETVTLLNENTPVLILDTSNAEWYGISANGMTGYVYSQYIQTESSSAVAADIMVTDAYLNLRKTADRNGDILLVIPENTAVAVTNKSSAEWYSVSYNGKTGYVSPSYLK